jgi:hypothetical protein
MTRLYWWFTDAPKDRVGGPWWHKDFDSVIGPKGLNRFLDTLFPFIYAYSISENLPDLDPMEIAPQEGDEVIQVNATTRAKRAWICGLDEDYFEV